MSATAVGEATLPRAVWRGFAVAGLALVALDVLLAVAAPRAVADTAGTLIGLTVSVGAVVALAVGVTANRPRCPRAWWSIAAGLSLWVAGDLAASLSPAWGQAAAYALQLLGYPLLALGVWLIVRARTPERDLAGAVDAMTVAAGMLFVGYVSVVAPLLDSDQTTADDLAVLVAFLVGDIVLFAGFVRVITVRGAWTRATQLLSLSLCLLLAYDFTLLALERSSTAPPSWLVDLAVVGFLAIGASALHPTMLDVTRPAVTTSTALGARRLVLAGAASLVPSAALVAQSLGGQVVHVGVTLAGSAVLVGLVLTRLGLAVESVQRISRQAVELRDQLAYEATHDALTLLPNRAHGIALLRQALARSATGRSTVTVMFLDLDGFKLVNDALGHRAGDQLLRRVAERLTQSVRGGDVAIRLGGDEFVLVMESLEDAATALQVATRVIQAVSTPVHLGPQGTARVGASIGIAQCADGTTDPETLLNEADVAAYRAKMRGKGRAELFDTALRQHVLDRERLALDLRQAIAQDQLELDYQPVVDSLTGDVRGYEALVRWQHPTRGRLSPRDFLPVAESSDLICELDRWVLHRATAQMQQWIAEGVVDGPVVAVNVSVVTAARTRLVGDVADALAASGLQADRLVLELPERVLDDLERTVEHLRAVRTLGVSVSVADFGSAVGSLARMAELPVNVVKIGRTALETGTPLGEELLRLMIQGAHAVGLNAVAEGVERDEQLSTLRTLDCEMVQGFHIARPMPAAQVPAYQRAVTDRFSGLLP